MKDEWWNAKAKEVQGVADRHEKEFYAALKEIYGPTHSATVPLKSIWWVCISNQNSRNTGKLSGRADYDWRDGSCSQWNEERESTRIRWYKLCGPQSLINPEGVWRNWVHGERGTEGTGSPVYDLDITNRERSICHMDPLLSLTSSETVISPARHSGELVAGRPQKNRAREMFGERKCVTRFGWLVPSTSRPLCRPRCSRQLQNWYTVSVDTGKEYLRQLSYMTALHRAACWVGYK